MRYIKLKLEEKEALKQLHSNSSNHTVRKRSHCFLLSDQGHTITNLAAIFDVNRRTIERWFDSWTKNGVNSLEIAEGRDAKTLLRNYSKEVSEQLELHNRNLKNVLIYFEEQHGVVICKKTLRNFLKVNGL